MTFEAYCIANKQQNLLDEWDEINGNLTPAMVLITSRAKVWWKCSCGNVWAETVERRVNGRGCIVCNPPLKILNTNKSPKMDLTGQTFGRLEVQEYVGVQKESMWKCKCECGNEVVVAHHNLTSGKTTSCGCRQEEVRKENFKNNIHFVEGTCIEKIAAKTTPKNNTSGFRGVDKRSNGRFRASITFKGKRYDLGSYATLEEAIEARRAGETMMDEFVENFKKANCNSIPV